MRTGPQRAGSRARKCARRAFSSPHTFCLCGSSSFFWFLWAISIALPFYLGKPPGCDTRALAARRGRGGTMYGSVLCAMLMRSSAVAPGCATRGCIAKPPLRWCSSPVAPMRKRQCTGTLSRAHAGRESRPHTLSTTNAQGLQRTAAHFPAFLTSRFAWLLPLCRCSRTCVRCISSHKASRATACLRYHGFAL